jgi:hypothetical protein
MGSMSPGPGLGGITPPPYFGAEVSYTIRKAWYIYKSGCAVLFKHVWPCILVPSSFLGATKNNSLFWGVQELGDDSRQRYSF